ncbi:MAG: alpha/beta hydrolase [Chitinophagaceae bacterium]|nr:alpha/beta hydrolase [Chitinophagaceae bacterium]
MIKLFFSFFALVTTTAIFGQSLVGDWEGAAIVQGTELPIIFHLSKYNVDNYGATFDSPKQQAFGIACSDVIVKEDSVIILIPVIKGSYAGKLNNNKREITGNMYQSGAVLALDLKKTSDVSTVKEMKRPQTPKPPFSYKSEDIIYANADKSIQFGATFTVPLPEPGVDYFRAPIYPTVILISGSGKQDRDESIFGHKPFAVIADHLTRQGIAVLRVDDRGMGKTTGDFNKSTTSDFAEDVAAGIAYLKTRTDVDVDHIGLIGHSEGGLIAPMVASQRNDVTFVVLLAGPGIPILEMMEQQSADVMSSNGLEKSDIDQYRPLYKNTVTAIVSAKDSATASKLVFDIFKKWQVGKSPLMVKNTTGVESEKDITAFANAFIRDLMNPWFKHFMKMNPQDYLSKTNCAVLALNGEKDIQVAAKYNLAGIQSTLEKNKNKNFKVLEIPGLNHLFQHCKTCTVEEYGGLEESFDTATLELIANWIKTESTK